MQDLAGPIQGLIGAIRTLSGQKTISSYFLGSGPTQPAVPSLAHINPASRALAVPLLAIRRARREVVGRALTSLDDSDQPGAPSRLEGLKQPVGHSMARKALNSQYVEQIEGC